MSLQVFLQGQLLGTEGFLGLAHPQNSKAADTLSGRCAWLTLIGEVVPRALLAELKLSRMLLGSSSAEQFLLVLAEEDIPRANEFLSRAATAMAEVSQQTLRLVWASTENLGAWPIVRKRLDDALEAEIANPLGADANAGSDVFAPSQSIPDSTGDSFFAEFAAGMVTATAVGWSGEKPGLLSWDGGVHTWPLREHSSLEEEGILLPRRFAMNEEGTAPATLPQLAERAEGAARWGVLRGDVDHFQLQLRRAGSVEEHIHFSALFKEFFAGELALLCTLPDFWRKVTILYRGGNDFAVAGTWDALILLARELQRLFEKFAEQHLAGLPGVEAKSVSMAIAVAPELDSPAPAVFAEAGIQLQTTKATEQGSIYLFGRTLEWKRLSDAEDLKSDLVKLVREHRYPTEYLNDLASVYREAFSVRAGRRNKAVRVEKPWRTYLRLSRVIPAPRGREQSNLRSAVITSLIGKRMTGVKLKPSARVGLEWARLAVSA